MYSCNILADSINSKDVRLTTMEVTFPRYELPAFNTHRMFSRNTASSRAIPVKKLIEQVRTNPVIPVYFGKNQPGMRADEELTGDDLEAVKADWIQGSLEAANRAETMMKRGLHKEICNRPLELYLWTTVIVTATDWDNFFTLRCHPDAQRDIQKIAFMMRDALANNTPKLLQPGEWHTPLLADKIELLQKGYDLQDCLKIAVGRCCRVSYLTHNGVRDPQADLDLAKQLLEDGHMSPWEHVAKNTDTTEYYANFRGFIQYRKFIETR